MRTRSWLVILAALIISVLVLSLAYSLLPPAPIAPTPTWPLGIDLPDKLPRLRQ